MSVTSLQSMKQCLLAYYPLKGDANDYSGLNKNGTASSKVTYSPGQLASAAMFGQIGAVITLPAVFTGTISSYTLSAWACLNAYGPVPGDQASTGIIAGLLLIQNTDGTITFNFKYSLNGNTQYQPLNSSYKMQLGNWVNITFIYDEPSNSISLYVNGQLDSTGPVPSGITPLDPTLGLLGAFNSSGSAAVFNGCIGDVLFYNDSLDQTCINILSGYMYYAFEGSQNSIAQPEIGPAVFLITILLLAMVDITQKQTMINKIETQPSAPPPLDLQTIANRIKSIAGYPVNPTIKVTRSQIGIDNSYFIKLDIGGLGVYIHKSSGTLSGLPLALNLNDVITNVDADPAVPVPYLVYMPDWGTNPAYPFEDGFADYIVMQSSPLTPTNVAEINRVLKIGGSVGLWIDQPTFQNQINQLASLMNCTPIPCTGTNLNMDEFNGTYVFPKLLLTKNKPMSNPGTITVHNGGGYVAKFSVKYTVSGQTTTENSGDFPLGTNRSLGIPANAYDIFLTVEEHTGFSWNTIFTQSFGAPVVKCYKIWGTTFFPKWEEVSCSDVAIKK